MLPEGTAVSKSRRYRQGPCPVRGKICAEGLVGAGSGGHDPKAQIHGLRRMREQADRDEIDAGLGVGANVLQTNSAGAFQGNTRFYRRTALNRATHLLGRHIVEQDGFGAVGESVLEFVEGTHFDFDGLRAPAILYRALQHGNDAACQRDVIVLDKNSVGKIEAVILPAAAAHRVLVDHAEAGSGLPGVEDAGLRAGDSLDEFARESRDAAHTLQKVENHALTRQNHARIVADHRDRLALMKTHSIENFGMPSNFIVRSNGAVERGVDIENAADAANAGENAILLGQNRRRGALIRVDAGVAGGVARSPVFEQRVLENCGDASATKVHKNSRQLSVASKKHVGTAAPGCPVGEAVCLILSCSPVPSSCFWSSLAAPPAPRRVCASLRPPSPGPWQETDRYSAAADCSRTLFQSSPVLSSSARTPRRHRSSSRRLHECQSAPCCARPLAWREIHPRMSSS